VPAALGFGSIAEILLSIVLALFVAGYLVRRRRRLPLSWLVARDGRVVLSDKGRAKIVKRGFDTAAIEASIDETFELNESGEIVLSEAGCEAARSRRRRR
jgi:hypothetical protein